MIDDIASARSDGRLPNDDAIAFFVQSMSDRGQTGTSMRAIDVKVWNGMDLRILPDRGLDIGQAWFRGQPLAWISAIGETGPLSSPEGREWSAAFGGGLMVTCGLHNVGAPSEGHGLHGRLSHLPAGDVTVERSGELDRVSVAAQGVVIDDSGAAPLQLNRNIETMTGRGQVNVVDEVTNTGGEPVPAPILYHFNFGYPLWGPGARLEIDSERVTPRDEASETSLNDWAVPPSVVAGPERVLEHQVAVIEGWSSATLANERMGLRLRLSWRAAELPRLHQWVDPSPGMYVLGIEPANCSTGGRAFDREEGRLPHLGPGETRETVLRIDASLV